MIRRAQRRFWSQQYLRSFPCLGSFFFSFSRSHASDDLADLDVRSKLSSRPWQFYNTYKELSFLLTLILPIALSTLQSAVCKSPADEIIGQQTAKHTAGPSTIDHRPSTTGQRAEGTANYSREQLTTLATSHASAAFCATVSTAYVPLLRRLPGDTMCRLPKLAGNVGGAGA